MRVKLQQLIFLLAGWFVCISAAWGDGHLDTPGAVLAIGGTASEHDRDVVGIAVATAARSAGWRLSRKYLTKQDADGLIDCAVPGDPLACVPASIDAHAIHHALIVVVESQQTDGGAPMLVLTGKVIATRPAKLVVHQRFCEHCAGEQLAQASTELTLRLLRDLAVRTGRTLLEVNSTPLGASITVDGHPVGTTNDLFNTSPGLHVVTLQKPGFLPETVKIRAEEGKTATISATLRVRAPPPLASPPPSGLLPAGLAGSGVSLVAAGTFIYFDKHDGANDKYTHPRATLIGTAVGLVGLGAIGTAVYLWWHSSTTPTATAAAPAIPVINVAPDGGWVGWMSTF